LNVHTLIHSEEEILLSHELFDDYIPKPLPDQ